MKQKLPSFNNSILFDLALTHSSYANEHPEISEDNERLEFLGDAVLGFVVAEMLYRMYPTINEAQLTHLRSRLVNEKQLGKLGAEYGLGELMRLGKGTAQNGGRETFIDSKNRFQQWALANYQTKPEYRIITESGPDHAKEFTAQVSINREVYGVGTAHRKQEAEKKAAEVALHKLKSS